MKKITLLMLTLWLLLNQLSLAQTEETKKIEIDFKAKSIVKMDTLEEGDLYQLHIKGINMNLYKISYEGKDSIIDSNVSFPTIESVGLNELTKLVSNILPLSTSGIKSKVEDLNLLFNKSTAIDYLKNEIILSNKELIERINNYISYMQDQTSALSIANYKIDSLNLSVQTLALSYLVEDNEDLEEKLKSNLDFKKVIDESEKLRLVIRMSMKEVEDSLKAYKSFYNKKKDVFDSKNELKMMNKSLVNAFLLYNTNANKVFESVNSEIVIGWLSSLIHLDNNAKKEFLTLPMQLNGDFATINIRIEPKKEEFGLPSYHTSIKFPEKRRNYIGLGMSFYHAGFKNEYFSISSSLDSTQYNIVDEKQPNGEIGIATLLHFGCKPFNDIKNLGVHFSIGPAFSISSSLKTRLAAGGGIAYGKKQMISLDIMAIAGYVDRISNLYNTSITYLRKPEQITVSELKYSWSLAIGYIYKF